MPNLIVSDHYHVDSGIGALSLCCRVKDGERRYIKPDQLLEHIAEGEAVGMCGTCGSRWRDEWRRSR